MMRIIICALVTVVGLAHASAGVSDSDKLANGSSVISAGDTSWVLTSTALVYLMIPGVSILYGGLIRSKNMISVMMQGLVTSAVVTVVWVTVGYSLAFGPGDFIGDLNWGGLTGVNANGDQEDSRPFACPKTIPVLAFMVFQMAFATLTPVLIGGAVAGRMRFLFWTCFTFCWSILVYCFIAKWMFGNGWLAQRGAIDFAGGTVVHITSGSSALVLCLMFGRRKGWPETSPKPHSLPLSILGLGLTFFGDLGFNAGSALAADYIAAQAFVNTFIGGFTGCLGWWIADVLKGNKISALGAMGGILAGLVGITPSAGFVSGLSSIFIGASTGFICSYAVTLKFKWRIDDSVDVVGVHFVGGFWGTIMVGFFADKSFNPNLALTKLNENGIFWSADNNGRGTLLGNQILAAVVTTLWSMAMTFIIIKVLGRFMVINVTEAEEDLGLDLVLHGEIAYHELSALSSTQEPVKNQKPTDGYTADSGVSVSRSSTVSDFSKASFLGASKASFLGATKESDV